MRMRKKKNADAAMRFDNFFEISAPKNFCLPLSPVSIIFSRK